MHGGSLARTALFGIGLALAASLAPAGVSSSLSMSPVAASSTLTDSPVADPAMSIITTDSSNNPAVSSHALEGRASAGGHFVAFRALDPNLDHTLPVQSSPSWFNSDYMGYLYLRDTVAGTTTRIDVPPASDLTFGGTENFRYDITSDGRYVVFTEFVHRTDGPAYQVLYSYDARNRTLTQLTSYTDAQGNAMSDIAPLLARDADQAVWTGEREVSPGTWEYNAWLVDLATGEQRGLLTTTDGQPCTPALCDSYPDAISPDGSTVHIHVFASGVAYSGPTDTGGGVFVSTATGLATAFATASGASPYVSLYDNSFHALTDRYFTFIGHPSDWGRTGGDRTFRYDLATGDITELFGSRPPGVIGYVDQSTDGRWLATLWNDGTTQHLGVYDTESGAFVPVGILPNGNDPVGVLGLSLAPTGDVAVFSAGGDYGWGDGRATYAQALPGASSVGLTAIGGDEQVSLSWHNPTSAALVVVRRSSTETAPQCSSCGAAVYRGVGRRVVSGRLTNGHRYTFAVFTKTSTGRLISRKVAAAKPHKPRGTLLSASSGGTLPANRPLTFTGALRWASTGLAVAHRFIRVYSRRHGTTTWHFVTRVRSSWLGYYRFDARPSTTRDYQFRYLGDKSYAPSRSHARTVRVVS